MPTILVVEDDPPIRQGIADALAFAGYEALTASDGEEGKRLALTAACDLILLDLVLPRCSGFDILEALKAKRPGQPVIILSARGEENDRVRGLTLGADDYVVKPFSARELLARVHAVLRRAHERRPAAETHRLAGIEIDLARETLTHPGGEPLPLSEKETGILRCLLANAGRPVPRPEILRQVWGIENPNIETRAIDMHVAQLRKKLRDPGQELLQTIRGKGYQLTLP